MKPESNLHFFSCGTACSNVKEQERNNTRLNDDDLPDGSCFSRVLRIETLQHEQNINSTVRECEYIGTFAVPGDNHSSRAEFVRTQLEQIKDTVKRRSVLLVISLTGVKVCCPNGKSVLMAHALRRISFATCDPESNQFSFLAREPNGHANHQFCHSFVTSDAQQAEELSRVVGASFRMAYAQQFAQPLSPTVAIQTPIEAQQLQCSSSLLITSPALRSPTCNVDITPHVTRTHWAKKVYSKAKHLDPIADQASEMNKKKHPTSKSEPKNPSTQNRQSGMNCLGDKRRRPGRLEIGERPLLNSDSSSNESNSPTDLNSCKQLKDKPPMRKNLEVVCEGASADYNFAAERPSSGAYINEKTSWEDDTAGMNISSGGEGKKRGSGSDFSDNEEHSFSVYNPASPRICNRPTCTGACGKRLSRSSSRHEPPPYPPSFEDVLGETRASRRIIRDRNSRSAPGRRASVSPPPIPERYDSLSITLMEEKELKYAPWFQAGIPREITLEILKEEPMGSFMVRESTSKPGCFALSLRVPEHFQEIGIAHYLIMKSNRGYKIKGFMKEFPTLTALITHHSIMPELLPCPLSLSKHNRGFKKSDSDMADMNDDPDYALLSDFRNMFSDLNA